MITPEQTMDVLFKANQTLCYYCIAASPYLDSVVEFRNSTATTIVQYQDNYNALSSSLFLTLPAYNDIDATQNFTKSTNRLANNQYPFNVPKSFTTQIYIAVSINLLSCPNKSCDTYYGNRTVTSLNNVSFDTRQIVILQGYYGYV